jgi:hypothetical protein
MERERIFGTDEAAPEPPDGDEVLELLRSSALPPPPSAAADDADDFGPVVTADQVARAVEMSGRGSVMFLPSPRRDRHVMAWTGAAAVIAVLLGGGFAIATLREGPAPLPSDVFDPAPGLCAAPGEGQAASSAFWTPLAAELHAAPATAPAARAAASRPSVVRPASALGRPGEVADAAPFSPIPDNPYADVAIAAPAPRAAPRDVLEGLIESALARPAAPAAAQPRPNSLPGSESADALPERPAREDVRRAMESLSDQVRACGGGGGDRLVVEAVVRGETGRVESARAVDDRYVGTSVGACAARAVRVAKLPRFAYAEVRIRYPFDL